ncbi:GNAT family N-acetyltransferase [Pseudaestuariivita rosea]|uniref:GNAT family N-acetyltransferase n=1 Tax=Pseudaestuariivita rosea TaxID=2763263 RepID=UPI001ABA7DC6|nr:N-acetyltransferase [Pseudaestuariivita rosea]
MNLRQATLEDASSLAVLSIEVWADTYLRNGISPFFADYALGAFTKEKIEDLLKDSNQLIIVSDSADGINGYVRVQWNAPAPGEVQSDTEIATLYVRRLHHGKGIGQQLITQVLKDCRARQVASVWLTVNSENARAIRFYEKLRFRRAGKTDFIIEDKAYPNELLALDF